MSGPREVSERSKLPRFSPNLLPKQLSTFSARQSGEATAVSAHALFASSAVNWPCIRLNTVTRTCAKKPGELNFCGFGVVNDNGLMVSKALPGIASNVVCGGGRTLLITNGIILGVQ
jgi:hypothetical protein